MTITLSLEEWKKLQTAWNEKQTKTRLAVVAFLREEGMPEARMHMSMERLRSVLPTGEVNLLTLIE
jgi:hypothetical protein